MPTAVFDESVGIDRDGLIAHLKVAQIDSRPFFYPLTSLPMFESRPENKVAYSIYDRGINLPSHHELDHDDAARVTAEIRNFLNS